MKVFELVISITITGLRNYSSNYSICDLSNTTKKLQLIPSPKNKFDKNAIIVKLDDKQIGFVDKNDASKLSPLLLNSNLIVSNWKFDDSSSRINNGFMVIQVKLIDASVNISIDKKKNKICP